MLTSSWWLQMSLRQRGAKSSATILKTGCDYRVTWTQLRIIHCVTAIELLSLRYVRRLATRWLLCRWRLVVSLWLTPWSYVYITITSCVISNFFIKVYNPGRINYIITSIYPSYIYNVCRIVGRNNDSLDCQSTTDFKWTNINVCGKGRGLIAYARQGNWSSSVPVIRRWLSGAKQLHRHITVTSQRARWRLKSPASRLFTQPFIQAQIKENIKAPRHWPLWIHRWPVNSQHKWPITRKMFPCDDVIMNYQVLLSTYIINQ